ncbi:MAG: hypothetical protein MOB07_24395 [Acidobacteria bacterium]|nr:hypothetical protein [Acidobacteriota bacterium]
MTSTMYTNRSNRSLFIPRDSGSPHDGLMAHLSSLGQIARLDFERCAVAGEIIYAIEGDSLPVSQQDEEARIGSLTYALKKLGNAEDSAEFIRCLNAICEEGDARYRQVAASHYYGEISTRGSGDVLKEMALVAMQLASLHPIAEETETDFEAGYATPEEEHFAGPQSLFDQEVEAITRLVRGRRKSASFIHDEITDWLNDLEAGGASAEEMDTAFAHAEAMEQYDEGGAVIVMSSHERTMACGRIDPEFAAEDLPERAQYLVAELRQAYVNGVRLEEMWDDLNAQIEVLFPVSGKTENGGRFYSHANREIQAFCREVLEAILADCQSDFHLTALRNNRDYRQFHKAIRRATDTKVVGEVMKRAFGARMAGSLPLKHFTALKTAAALQRERLESQPPSAPASQLLKEIATASDAKLRYLSWAFYGNNQPAHPIHTLAGQEVSVLWQALNARKQEVSAFRKAA